MNLTYCIPYIVLSVAQVPLNTITAKSRELLIKFGSWELVRYPTLPESTRHTCTVKTSNKVETRRHILSAFQNNKRDNLKENMSHFNHCSFTNIELSEQIKTFQCSYLYK